MVHSKKLDETAIWKEYEDKADEEKRKRTIL